MQTPLVELKHFVVTASNTAKAIIRVTHKQGSRGNTNLVIDSIRAKLNNTMEPVEGTFTVLSSDAFSETYAGVLRTIRQSIPFVEGQTRGFSAFASNMFMDTEKNIWTLKQTDSGKLLVQTSSIEDEEALNELLASYSSTSSRYSPEHKQYVATASSHANVIGGDLAYYVNKHGDSKVGYIVATVTQEGKPDGVMVLDHDADKPEVIDPTVVLAKLDASNAPQLEETKSVMHSVIASTSSVTLQDMLEYYKQMFKRDPQYYAMFEERLRKSAVI